MLPVKEIQRAVWYTLTRLRQEEQQIHSEIAIEHKALHLRTKVIKAENKTSKREDVIVLELQRNLRGIKRDKSEFGKRIVDATKKQLKGLGKKDRIWHHIISYEERMEELEEEKLKLNQEIIKDIDTQISALNMAYRLLQRPDFISSKSKVEIYIKAIKLYNKRQGMKKKSVERKNHINRELIELARKVKNLRSEYYKETGKAREYSPKIQHADEQIAAA